MPELAPLMMRVLNILLLCNYPLVLLLMIEILHDCTVENLGIKVVQDISSHAGFVSSTVARTPKVVRL